MKLRINKAHYPVTVLGYGKRIGLWLQGCSIGCPGCCSQDTWETNSGAEIAFDDLLSWCKDISAGQLDGITLSGGEPFEQADALLEFLQALRQWTNTLANPVDLLCYSGYSWRHLQNHYGTVLNYLDAIISEPYVSHLPAAVLRGSNNQQLIPLTPLGEIRYSAPAIFPEKRLQLQVDNNQIWMIGIPEPGDLLRIESACQAQGLILQENSWRA